jgi:hypothetical protein
MYRVLYMETGLNCSKNNYTIIKWEDDVTPERMPRLTQDEYKSKTKHFIYWPCFVNINCRNSWLTETNRSNTCSDFWDVLPCKMIVDRRFRGAYCLHHQGVMTIILHGSTFQKTILNIILAAVRTRNLT